MSNVDENQLPTDEEYDEFVRHKVELARRQIALGLYFSSEEVEAHFAARRATLSESADAALQRIREKRGQE